MKNGFPTAVVLIELFKENNNEKLASLIIKHAKNIFAKGSQKMKV